MSSAQRREQLILVARRAFADRGFDATSIEEIAARAKVSKPVVYEHFGGKEGLYAVVVDREVRSLLDRVTKALTGGHPRELLEQAALALLDYIEDDTDGFRVLVRDSPVMSGSGNFSSVLNDVAHQTEAILGREFKSRGFDTKLAELYSQALVGMVGLAGRWWLEARKPKKEAVAAHLVNLAWNGLSHLEPQPQLGHRPEKLGVDGLAALAAVRLGGLLLDAADAAVKPGGEHDQAEDERHDDGGHGVAEEVQVGAHQHQPDHPGQDEHRARDQVDPAVDVTTDDAGQHDDRAHHDGQNREARVGVQAQHHGQLGVAGLRERLQSLGLDETHDAEHEDVRAGEEGQDSPEVAQVMVDW
jgi:AcrR family transcriptional regulator